MRYADLHDPTSLAALDARFRVALAAQDPPLAERFEAYRAGAELRPPDESELLIAVARPLSEFVARLFGVESGRQALIDFAAREQAVFRLKEFIARRAAKKYPAGVIHADEAPGLRAEIVVLAATVLGEAPSSKSNGVARAAVDEELLIGRAVSALLDIEDPYRRVAEGQTTDAVPAALAEQLAAICARLPARPAPDLAAVRAMLDRFERWAAIHRHDAMVKHAVAGWVSFHIPHHIDHEHLVPLRRPHAHLPNVMEGLPEHRRRRDGFTLTDARMPPREILNEVDYCLYCHDREKDSCSTGLRDKQGAVKKNPLGIALNGCPLDERISEMHVLKKGGDSLAALAMITIDNPMLPGTGHRI